MADLSNGQLTTQGKRILRAAGITPTRVRTTWGLTTLSFATVEERDAALPVLAAAGWTYSANSDYPFCVATSPDSYRFSE